MSFKSGQFRIQVPLLVSRGKVQNEGKKLFQGIRFLIPSKDFICMMNENQYLNIFQIFELFHSFPFFVK